MADAKEFIESEISRVDEEIQAHEDAVATLRAERELLGTLRSRAINADIAPLRMGPADAVRFFVENGGNGIPRAELIRRALEVVTTPREKAYRAIDQTIRNLDGKDIEVRDGKVFSRNGHAAR